MLSRTRIKQSIISSIPDNWNIEEISFFTAVKSRCKRTYEIYVKISNINNREWTNGTISFDSKTYKRIGEFVGEEEYFNTPKKEDVSKQMDYLAGKIAIVEARLNNLPIINNKLQLIKDYLKVEEVKTPEKTKLVKKK